MNKTELQALRRLLFFSAPEAAQWVAASEERPAGVSERAWRLWEAGERPIPADVAECLRSLADWRSLMLANVGAEIAEAQIKTGSLPGVVLVWYKSLTDWLNNGEPELIWRPQHSVLAHLAATHKNVRLAEFDAASYSDWLAGRKDSPAMRSAWAGLQ